ncbi:MAG: hypothetical protein ACI4S2_13115 [Lachnospiraceae bacterium]
MVYNGGGLDVALYLALIGLYTRLSSDPIIFFASISIAAIATIIICVTLHRLLKGEWDAFTTTIVGFAYFLGIIIIAVFGPTFIDRSISYHIAFYAVEEENIDVDEMREVFSEEIFDKRIHDAITTGFVTENENGTLSPTGKAKIMYYVLKPIGNLTNSFDTYENMKEMMSDE